MICIANCNTWPFQEYSIECTLHCFFSSLDRPYLTPVAMKKKILSLGSQKYSFYLIIKPSHTLPLSLTHEKRLNFNLSAQLFRPLPYCHTDLFLLLYLLSQFLLFFSPQSTDNGYVYYCCWFLCLNFFYLLLQQKFE